MVLSYVILLFITVCFYQDWPSKNILFWSQDWFEKLKRVSQNSLNRSSLVVGITSLPYCIMSVKNRNCTNSRGNHLCSLLCTDYYDDERQFLSNSLCDGCLVSSLTNPRANLVLVVLMSGRRRKKQKLW